VRRSWTKRSGYSQTRMTIRCAPWNASRAAACKGVDQSLINQLESIIIVFIKYQNQSMAADGQSG